MKNKRWSKEELINLLSSNSIKGLANKYNISVGTIYRDIKAFNIKLPKYNQDKNWYYDKYVNEKLSANEIGELINLSKAQVLRRLKHYDIPIRNLADSLNLSNQNRSNALKSYYSKSKNKKKKSKIAKGLHQNSDYKNKLRNIHNSKEFKNSQSKKSSNLWKDEEYKKKILATKSSNDHKQKLSNSIKNKWSSDVVYANKIKKILKDSATGRIINEDTKRKLSDAAKKKWQNSEHKDKMHKIFSSDSHKKKLSKISKKWWSDNYNIMIDILNSHNYKNKMKNIQNSKEYKNNISNKMKAWWFNNYDEMINIITSEKNRNKIKLWWNNEENRNKMLKIFNSDVHKNKLSKKAKKWWSNDDNHKMMSEKSSLWWSDEDNRNKMLKIFRSDEFKLKIAKINADRPKVSSLQKIFYSLLDDLDIKHHREHEDKPDDKECCIAKYTFDCVIPVYKILLIIPNKSSFLISDAFFQLGPLSPKTYRECSGVHSIL